MEFKIYYASGRKFDKDDFDFFEKNHIKYGEDKSNYVVNDTILLPNFDWSKIKCLYDYFKPIVIYDRDIIIYNAPIE